MRVSDNAKKHKSKNETRSPITDVEASFHATGFTTVSPKWEGLAPKLCLNLIRAAFGLTNGSLRRHRFGTSHQFLGNLHRI